MCTLAYWREQYSKGLHDYLSDGKTAEIGRYSVILGYLIKNDIKGVIVDYGCGKGLLGSFITNLMDGEYIGVDYLPEIINEAKKNVPKGKIIEGDMRRPLDIKDAGAIIFNESLYYLDTYIEVFQNAFSQIGPQGIVIVSMYSTPITNRIWKDISRYKLPAERLRYYSVLGREKFKFEIAFWHK
jgi:trans-aconitate methyltransferase